MNTFDDVRDSRSRQIIWLITGFLLVFIIYACLFSVEEVSSGTGKVIPTSREQQVLSLLKQGRSNKEIARALTIAEATVKNHVHHVLEKLQVATRGQAAAAGPPPLKARLTPRSSRQAG